MKTISAWIVALITCLVSLAAMCLFDFILSVIYYFIGKVPFLTDIIDYIGEILDLGLTVLIAITIAITIWQFGHSAIKQIKGTKIGYTSSPVFYINTILFFILFLAMVVFLGFEFATQIGKSVITYTDGLQGFPKFLMFFVSIKDTFSFVCAENIILYKLGSNAFVLFGINVFANKFIDGE